MATSTIFRSQFDRLEPLDIFPIEKHESYNGRFTINFERMPTEYCSFYYDTIGIDR